MGRQDAESETLIPTIGGGFDVAHSLRGEGFDASEDGTGRGTPLVPVTYPINTQIAMRHEALGEGTGMGIGAADDPAFTLQSAHSHAIAFKPGGMSGTLVKNQTMAVAYGMNATMIGRQDHNGPNGKGWYEEISPTNTKSDVHAVATSMQVRRLTPVECERLQGFPDGYTDIKPNGKPTADGPRYKALGNSMAVPVMRWIGERIDMVSDVSEQMEIAA